MKRIGLILSLCVVMPLLGGCGELPTGAGQPVAFRIVASAGLTVYAPSQRTEVIKTPEEWQRVWSEVHPGDLAAAPLPPIDFQREAVLFVARGRQPDSCHGIQIAGVNRAGGRTEVIVNLSDVEGNCGCLQAVTYPMEAVAIPATGDSVHFTLRRGSKHC